jgi:AraC-like DNA-binding protein
MAVKQKKIMAKSAIKRALVRDPESIHILTEKTLTPEERREIQFYTIQDKKGVCLRANLQGKLSTILAGMKTAAQGYNFQLSKYPFFRITYTISGQATLKDSSGEHAINAGSVYYFAPKESGTIINNSDTPWTHIYIHFTGTEAAGMLKKITAISKHTLMVSKPERIRYLFEYIVDNCVEQHEDSQAICDSLLRNILLLLPTSAIHYSKHLNTSQLNFIQCRNYITGNFSNITSVQDIVENCHLSDAYICRLFRKYSDTSPMAYVTQLKMNQAALLLLQTDYSVKKISMMMSFSNQYYFSKTFKKAYGSSPAYYRASH